MARIRTFKPEFFRSPDTAKASPRARLLYMAMWSWADDEGVGETNIYGLLGFAFPDSDNLTAEDLQSLLKEIRGSYGVLFYECRGRFYYAIPSWDSHQKTERRAKARFPKPDDPEAVPDLRFGTSEDLRGNSLQTEGRSPLGTGEQGNRGTDHVGATQVSHLGAQDAGPPRKCARHANTPNPPDCGGCAQARREHKAWQQLQARREADELEAKRAAKVTAAQTLTDCPLCDEEGWLLDADGLPVEPAVKCDHQPAPEMADHA